MKPELQFKTTYGVLKDGSYELKARLESGYVKELADKCVELKADHLTSLSQGALASIIAGYLHDAKSFPELLRRTMLLLEMIGAIGEHVTASKAMDLMGRIVDKKEQGKSE